MPEGDRVLFEEILQEQRVGTTPPATSFAEWLAHRVAKLWESWFDAAYTAGAWGEAALVVLGIVAVGLGTMLILLLVRRLARPKVQDPPRRAPQPGRAARLSRAEVERVLARGDTRGAALLGWWWLVEGLGRQELGTPHPDHTHQEYVGLVRTTHAGWPHHAALRRLAQGADVLGYAPEAPTPDAVRGWLDEADTLLNAGAPAEAAG